MANESTTSPAVDDVESDNTHEQASQANGATTTSSISDLATQNVARKPSNNVASLRAAFEGKGSGSTGDTAAANHKPDGLKRRLPSGEHELALMQKRAEDQEAELTKLREDFAQERELRTAYEERVTGLEEEVDELNGRLEARESEAERTLNTLRDDAAGHRRENSTLQQQLADLKRSISASLRPGVQTTDSALEQEFEILQHEVQNWVVNFYRKAKTEATGQDLCERLESLGKVEHLALLKAIYARFVPARKLAAHQAAVACHLMEIFDDRSSFAMPSDQEWPNHILKALDSLSTVLDASAYNRWRAATFDAVQHSDAMGGSRERATIALAGKICLILENLTEVKDDEGKVLATLKPIINRAVKIASLLSMQRARYQVLLPAPGDNFDNLMMEDTLLDDGESDDNGAILCATFPAVIKFGDEAGENPEQRNVLSKAQVLREEEE